MPKSDKPKSQTVHKRPLSAYFLFSNAQRLKIKQQVGDKNMMEASKIVANELKTIVNNMEKKYGEQAKVLKAKYIQDLRKYKNSFYYKKYLSDVARWKEKAKNNQDTDEDTAGENVDNDENVDANKKKR